MIKAIIFDFDGTIIDTETIWYQVYKDILRNDYNIVLPLEEFAKVIGTTDEVLYKYIESQTNSAVNREVIEEKAHDYFQSLKGKLVLRDGVLDLIITARKLGMKLAVASSSNRNWIEDFLLQFQLLDYFTVIKSKNDVKKVKPDPELYVTTVQALGIEPHEALAIEDSVNGSVAAIEAGVPCIVVPNEVTSFLEFDRRVDVYGSFSQIKLESFIES